MEKSNWIMIKTGIGILMVGLFWSIMVICQRANDTLRPTPPLTPVNYELQRGQIELEFIGWDVSFNRQDWQRVQSAVRNWQLPNQGDWLQGPQLKSKLLTLKDYLLKKSERVVSLWETTVDSWETGSGD